jgi:alpha-L-fucosidase
MMDGRIEKRQIDRLKDMGNWLKEYGETIYNTEGGPIPPQEWGVSTRKKNTIYLHVLEPEESITIDKLTCEISDIQVYSTGKNVPFRQRGTKLTINLPDIDKNLVDLVLVAKEDNL